ncbi:MAG: 50S ribosomal protein L25 [Candidatus Dasytiphilus stammeri]
MITIFALIKKQHGKSVSRRLRIADKLPAIIYGGKQAPIAIILDQKKIMNLQNKDDFYHQSLILIIEGLEHNVKVHSVQQHPFKPKMLHIDFIRV